MKNRIIFIITSLLLVFITGCKEEGRVDYFNKNAPAPAQVKITEIRNTPGGAVLKYKVPNDENLLYVKAVYEIQPGVQLETKSSYYKDSLVLEGFGAVRTYDVNLYSVGKNEKASEPLTVQINPDTPPIQLASLELNATFGGVSVKVNNPKRANLAIVLMGDTAQLGYQTTLQTFYMSGEKANFSYRGLDAIPLDFSIYMRDRWGNLSDIKTATLTPWFMEFIPKDTWREVHLPTDSWEPAEGRDEYAIRQAWSNDFDTWYVMLFNKPAAIPHWFTWDLGITVRLCFFKIWHHPGYEWGESHPKKFELYGSMEPNKDGIWDDSWIPLGKFESIKPSGIGTPITADDIAFATAGIDFELEENEFSPNPFVPVRYIRFKLIENMRGPVSAGSTQIKQISFWGIIQ